MALILNSDSTLTTVENISFDVSSKDDSDDFFSLRLCPSPIISSPRLYRVV